LDVLCGIGTPQGRFDQPKRQNVTRFAFHVERGMQLTRTYEVVLKSRQRIPLFGTSCARLNMSESDTKIIVP
jgi:hypothetical protein